MRGLKLIACQLGRKAARIPLLSRSHTDVVPDIFRKINRWIRKDTAKQADCLCDCALDKFQELFIACVIVAMMNGFPFPKKLSGAILGAM